ncbi:MAG: hypothetical protein ABI551_24100, partial [Polyangiaceae bacterium]
LDETNGNLFISSNDSVNLSRPGLVRCKIDGTACVHLRVSAASPGSGGDTNLALDIPNGQLLLTSSDGNSGSALTLFHCNLDGTSCAGGDIGGAGLSQPSMVVDAKTSTVYIAAGSPATLFRLTPFVQ